MERKVEPTAGDDMSPTKTDSFVPAADSSGSDMDVNRFVKKNPSSEFRAGARPKASSSIPDLQQDRRKKPNPSEANTRNGTYREDYEELDKLGEGAFGEVFKVRHEIIDHELAVKKIRFWSNDKIKKYTAEAQSLAKVCDHPNIISYRHVWLEESGPNSPPPLESSSQESQDSSTDQNNPQFDRQFDKKLTLKRVPLTLYIIMELCSFSLEDWLGKRNKNLPHEVDSKTFEPDISHIFRQVFEGVSHMHSKGLMHRDLKPPNILLLENDLRVKITDFGLVKQFVQDHSYSGAQDDIPLKAAQHTLDIGTPPYASPEQLDGPNYNEKTDLFSIGVMLYEACHPWTDDADKYEACDQLVKECKCPDEFKQKWDLMAEVVDDLVNRVPSDRPTAKSMLDRRLFLSKEKKLELKMAEMTEILEASGLSIRK